jgi:ribonucleoside-diphosphate reductase alpha chain
MEIWKSVNLGKVLESRQKKGLPYIFFTDNVNRNKPQVYKDKGAVINASNLCSEIMLPSTETKVLSAVFLL